MKLLYIFFIAFGSLLYAQEGANLVNHVSSDSTAIKIENKISFYEQQQKYNQEMITKLEKELEERKKLNERYTAAILVSKEILQEIVQEQEQVQEQVHKQEGAKTDSQRSAVRDKKD